MEKEAGFIQIHRKMQRWEWYSDSQMVHLFLHLLLEANHTEKQWKGHKIERGQLITGREKLSKTLGISPQSIKTCLTRLKSTSEITIKSTNKFSIITIVKYDEYQDVGKKSTSKSTSKSTFNQPTTNQQLTTTNNVNNVNNVNKYIAEASSAMILPDLLKDNKKHIQIIGLFSKAKKIKFENKEQQSSFIKRNLRSAQDLVGYDFNKIVETMKYLIDNADFKWTLESVGKYICENNLITKPKSEKEELSSIADKVREKYGIPK